MIALVVSLAAIGAVALLVVLKGPDPRANLRRIPRFLMFAAVGVLGVQAAFLIWLAAVGLSQYGSSALEVAILLFPFAPTAILGLLAWRRPYEGGGALVLVGLSNAILSGTDPGDAPVAGLLFISCPPLAAGALFICAAVGARVGGARRTKATE